MHRTHAPAANRAELAGRCALRHEGGTVTGVPSKPGNEVRRSRFSRAISHLLFHHRRRSGRGTPVTAPLTETAPALPAGARRRRLRALAVLVIIAIAHTAARAAAGADCASLAGLKLPNTTITEAQAITAGSFTPPAQPIRSPTCPFSVASPALSRRRASHK